MLGAIGRRYFRGLRSRVPHPFTETQFRHMKGGSANLVWSLRCVSNDANYRCAVWPTFILFTYAPACTMMRKIVHSDGQLTAAHPNRFRKKRYRGEKFSPCIAFRIRWLWADRGMVRDPSGPWLPGGKASWCDWWKLKTGRSFRDRRMKAFIVIFRSSLFWSNNSETLGQDQDQVFPPVWGWLALSLRFRNGKVSP